MPIPRPLEEPLLWLEEFPTLLEVADAWFDKDVVTIDVFRAMTQEAKTKAFSAVRAADDAARQKLKRLVGEAVTKGRTARELYADAQEILGDPAYADLVYRVNTSVAFQGGTYREMFGEGPGADYGYWKYIAIRDDRNDEEDECPELICRTLHGKIFAKDDEAAMKFLPPNHFQCRCDVAEVHSDENPRVTAGSSIGVRPQKGWDFDGRDLIPGGA